MLLASILLLSPFLGVIGVMLIVAAMRAKRGRRCPPDDDLNIAQRHRFGGASRQGSAASRLVAALVIIVSAVLILAAVVP